MTAENLFFFLVEPGVAATGIQRCVPEADVHQAIRIIGAHRQVTHAVDHQVVHAVIPLQRAQPINVAAALERVIGAAGESPAGGAGAGQVDAGFTATHRGNHRDRGLGTQQRFGKGVGGAGEQEVGAGIQAKSGAPAPWHGLVAVVAGTDVVVRERQAPARRGRRRSQRAELSGQPEADAAVIRQRGQACQRYRQTWQNPCVQCHRVLVFGLP